MDLGATWSSRGVSACGRVGRTRLPLRSFHSKPFYIIVTYLSAFIYIIPVKLVFQGTASSLFDF